MAKPIFKKISQKSLAKAATEKKFEKNSTEKTVTGKAAPEKNGKKARSAKPGASARSEAVGCDVIFTLQEVSATGGSAAPEAKMRAEPKASKRAILPPALASGPYAELLERLGLDGAYTSAPGTQSFVRYGGLNGAENVLFVAAPASLGTNAATSGQNPGVNYDPSAETNWRAEKARRSGGSAWSRLTAEKARSVRVHAEGVSRSELEAFLEGMTLAAYEAISHKSSSKASDRKPGSSEWIRSASADEAALDVSVVSGDTALQAEVESSFASLEALHEAVNLTRDWSNQPSNYGTPSYYASEAQRIAKILGLKCRVLGEAEALREKMGLFLAVGQGSEREGKIVVLEYLPPSDQKQKTVAPKGKASKAKANETKTVALVGKGVTFDSGGISIKPSLRMEEMKHDMTGAATVMGALALLARIGCPNRVIGILAFTENMPSGTALQPGNVITSRSGKTVEIFNTDAEGRLILGDALDFAQDFEPDAVIDIATLTGAVSVALGKLRCGLLGNDAGLLQSIQRIGEACGERMWTLPLDDEYFEDLKSEVADMKNSANDGNGGTIRGAIFLKQFIRKGVSWAHLDIAGTAYNTAHLPYFPKRGANGQFVRTLARIASEL
jgi:leucyl aminopeptidase